MMEAISPLTKTQVNLFHISLTYKEDLEFHKQDSIRTSSMRISGFSVLTFFRHWMTFPGMAPTYVRLGVSKQKGRNIKVYVQNTVEPLNNEVLGAMEINLVIYRESCCIRIKKTKI